MPTIRSLTSRTSAALTVAALVLLPAVAQAYGRPGPQSHPAPAARPAPPQPMRRMNPSIGPGPGTGTPVRGAHLGQWMQQHSNLTPQQQQRALQDEPGFRSLPPGTQATVMNRLNRLNSMPEQQRNLTIQNGEAMERMTPQQRSEVRNAMGQLGALPLDRRQAVARSFRDLRNMPPEQRNAILNSPQYRQQFSDEERGTLGNMLAVSPLLPPSR